MGSLADPEPRPSGRGSGLWRAWSSSTASQTGALAAAKYVAATLSLASTAVAARWLGPDDYGLAVLAIGFCQLLSSMTSFKCLSVATHYLSAFRAGGRRDAAAAICKLSVLIDVGAGVVAAGAAIVSLAILVPHVYPDLPIDTLVVTFALSLPVTGLTGTAIAALTATGRFRTLAVLTVLDRVVVLMLVVAALALGWGAVGFVAARALAQALSGIGLMSLASRALAQNGLSGWWRTPFGVLGDVRHELRSFFGWNYVSSTCTGLLDQLPLLILGRFSGPADAGFYSLARSVLAVAVYLETALVQVAFPKLSSASASEDVIRAMARAWRWTWRGGVPAAVMLAVGASVLPWILPGVLGSQFVPVVSGGQILLLGALVSALVFWVQPFYYAFGGINTWTKGLMIDTVIVVGLALPVASSGGWIGLCWLLMANRAGFRAIMTYRLNRTFQS